MFYCVYHLGLPSPSVISMREHSWWLILIQFSCYPQLILDPIQLPREARSHLSIPLIQETDADSVFPIGISSQCLFNDLLLSIIFNAMSTHDHR